MRRLVARLDVDDECFRKFGCDGDVRVVEATCCHFGLETENVRGWCDVSFGKRMMSVTSFLAGCVCDEFLGGYGQTSRKGDSCPPVRCLARQERVRRGDEETVEREEREPLIRPPRSKPALRLCRGPQGSGQAATSWAAFLHDSIGESVVGGEGQC